MEELKMNDFTLAPLEIMSDINDYVRNNLPNYKLMFAVRKSEQKDDEHLFMTVCRSKSDGTYAVWTCYNSITMSMNHGHYCIMTLEKVYEILNNYRWEN